MLDKLEIENKIQNAASLQELDEIFRSLLGRKGSIAMALRNLSAVSEAERKTKGAALNTLKQEVEKMIEEKSRALKGKEQEVTAQKEWLDVSAPGLQYPHGHVNPLTLVAQQMEDIFVSMGFAVVVSPEIEDEWHNFDALNVPADHPARDMWDTFWLKDASTTVHGEKSRLLLRTHISPMQIRYMETHKPPLRMIAPGRVFRYEAVNASHNLQFQYLEGMMIGDNVSIANFKGVIQEFFIRLLGKGATARMRPSFFPFVEPGFEIDMRCVHCLKSGGKDCPVCHGSKWLEIMGAGMVHPKVFDAVRYNSEDVQGFAFGVGMDRIAMLKYNIDDIRLLYSGDMRFLKQF